MFHKYDKKILSVTSHTLDPSSALSQTVTPSRTPSLSSVTYFMDGPNQETNWGMVFDLERNFVIIFKHFRLL